MTCAVSVASDGVTCTAESCDLATNIIANTGACSVCADKSHPDASNVECVADGCTDNEYYSSGCVACPTY